MRTATDRASWARANYFRLDRRPHLEAEVGFSLDAECRTRTLVADVALFVEGQVLLVRYRDMAKYDNESGWFLPDDELKYLELRSERARGSSKNSSACPA